MTQRRRKNSLRLKGYDYAQAGAYFVTILAYRRLHLFGSIKDGLMTLSKIGMIVENCWFEITHHFPSVELDVFVMMPNHLHGIVLLHENATSNPTLSQVMNTYKGAVTRTARQSLDEELETPVWHRNFHDHIIRSEREYLYIAQYVQTNPMRWETDSLNSPD